MSHDIDEEGFAGHRWIRRTIWRQAPHQRHYWILWNVDELRDSLTITDVAAAQGVIGRVVYCDNEVWATVGDVSSVLQN